MNVDHDSSFTRLPGGVRLKPKHQQKVEATRGQKAIEITLFAVFGLTIALAGVALYATNQPEHRRVPNMFSAGMHADRVNVLLIGSSIRTRAEGGTQVNIESLMLLSVQPSSGRAALMSIPVDLWVKVGGFGKRPLRAAHTVGDASGYPGAGVGLTVDTLSDIIDEPIHAYARVSIGDVHRLVNALGGVDVNVTRGVYEYKSKSRFRPGVMHMSGPQASHYAFSRHIAGVAASDRFAREDRQQEVMLAVLTKALSTPRSLNELAQHFGSLTATNLESDQVYQLADALRKGKGDIRRISFAPYVDSFDVSSVAYRGEAVGPRNGNFAALQKIADAALDTGVARVH